MSVYLIVDSNTKKLSASRYGVVLMRSDALNSTVNRDFNANLM